MRRHWSRSIREGPLSLPVSGHAARTRKSCRPSAFPFTHPVPEAQSSTCPSRRRQIHPPQWITIPPPHPTQHPPPIPIWADSWPSPSPPSSSWSPSVSIGSGKAPTASNVGVTASTPPKPCSSPATLPNHPPTPAHTDLANAHTPATLSAPFQSHPLLPWPTIPTSNASSISSIRT